MKSHSENAIIYGKRRKVANLCGWVCSILAILSVIGAIVLLVMLAFLTENVMLFALLALGAIVLAAVCGFGAFGFFRLSMNREKIQRDYLERADSEDSFFVGEDTLATFTENALKLHLTGGKKEKIVSVPYGELRFFSVCIRHAAKETGEWCVVLEIPAKYLRKGGKTKSGEPPVLVQTEGKQRLYDCLEKYNLPLLGEVRAQSEKSVRYTLQKRFILPDYAARRHKLLFAALGFVVAAVGVTLCFVVRDWLVVGVSVAAVGVYLAIHSAYGAYRARTVLALYREGIYWRQKTLAESTFLKWDEIESVALQQGEENVLRLGCAYGEYGFPAPNGAYEWIAETFPDKIEN